MPNDEDTIDKFLADTESEKTSNDRYKELRGRRAEEVKMWHHWNDNGRQEEHLEPLLKSLKPTITAEARRRAAGLGGSIPRGALETELLRHTVDALHKYDPGYRTAAGKPVQLNTYVHNNFQRITDYVAARRNIARLSKKDTSRYQVFQNAKTQFEEEHGREPGLAELATLLPQFPKKDIAKLQNAFTPEAFSVISKLEHDPGVSHDGYRSAVVLMRSQMKPEEQQFADLHYPSRGGTPKTVQQIAKAMNIPEHKAYRIRSRVNELIAPIVKEE